MYVIKAVVQGNPERRTTFNLVRAMRIFENYQTMNAEDITLSIEQESFLLIGGGDGKSLASELTKAQLLKEFDNFLSDNTIKKFFVKRSNNA